MKQAQGAFNHITVNSMPELVNIQRMKEAQVAVLAGERGLINRRMMNPTVRNAQYTWIERAYERAKLAEEALEKVEMTEATAKLWEDTKTEWDKWAKVQARVLELSREKDRMVAAGISLNDPQMAKHDQLVFDTGLQAREAFLATQTLFDEITATGEKEVAQQVEEFAAMSHRSLQFTIFLVVGAVAVSMGLGVIIALSVVKPVQATTGMLKDIAQGEGDLTRRLEVSGKDEIAELATWFNTFVDRIHDTLVEVDKSASRVASSSQELAATSEEAGTASQQIAQTIEEVARGSSDQTTKVALTTEAMNSLSQSIKELANGAEEQARLVETTVRSAKEIGEGIQSVYSSANSAGEGSAQVSTVAKEGRRSVEESILGMERIKETTQAAAQAIGQLGEASQRIGAIVEAIDDIAEQTNLLALNAAIEAARAGEHGKGFAVVADEVRKLAERSGKETKEIADLISNVQEITDNAIKAMASGTQEVENGTVLATQAGQSLGKILEAVDAVVSQVEAVQSASQTMNLATAEMMKDIESVSAITEQNTASAHSMAESSEAVGGYVDAVASISEQNAAAAEEVSASAEEQNAAVEELSASAEELSHVAKELQQIVGQFKINRKETSIQDTSIIHLNKRAA